MCCRYWVDETILIDLEEWKEFRQEVSHENRPLFYRRDILPSENAPVLVRDEGKLTLQECQWGFPASKSSGLIINARAETVSEKKTFRNGFQNHRIILPAAGFYEWNREKEKNEFTLPGSKTLFLAGIQDLVQNQLRFVILTTDANASMRPVHDRMPLIFDREQAMEWMFSDQDAEQLLREVPPELNRRSKYEQLSFFI